MGEELFLDVLTKVRIKAAEVLKGQKKKKKKKKDILFAFHFIYFYVFCIENKAKLCICINSSSANLFKLLGVSSWLFNTILLEDINT